MVTEQTERLTLTIEEAARVLGISRSTAYMLANAGRIPVIRISERRFIVPKVALERMLQSAGKSEDQD